MRQRLSYDQLVHQRVRRLYRLVLFLSLALVLRFAYLQVWRAPEFKEKAHNLTVRKMRLPAKRGVIYDRTGEKLAVSADAYDVQVRPAAVMDKAKTSDKLAALTGLDRDKIHKRLVERENAFYLKRHIDVEKGKSIKKAGLVGVDVLPTTKRIYLFGKLAAQVIGFTDVDSRGIEGLEKTYDWALRGEDGYYIAEIDALGREIPGTRREGKEPKDGMSIVLTIDGTLQHGLETELDRSFSDYKAAAASAIIMEPNTGEILALANRPTYDPNHVAGSDSASRRNRVVTDLYEPGSTMKTITACAALQEGVVGLNDTFYCRGSMRIGRRTIRCSLHHPFMNGHGASNLAKILKYSCNMGAAGVGLRLGKERLYKYEEAFGFYDYPGTEMPGEAHAFRERWQNWPDIRVANIAFGQGIAATPLQVARAYSALANGGTLMRPYIIKEIRRPDGTVERQTTPTPVRTVMSRENAKLVGKMLEGVVVEGTGKNANVPGYKVGGKTGSAQKAMPGGRGYVSGRIIASFVGFLPVSSPKAVILVAVDEPKGSHFGATVAAPVFQKAARQAMWLMKVPPDSTADTQESTVGRHRPRSPRDTGRTAGRPGPHLARTPAGLLGSNT